MTWCLRDGVNLVFVQRGAYVLLEFKYIYIYIYMGVWDLFVIHTKSCGPTDM